MVGLRATGNEGTRQTDSRRLVETTRWGIEVVMRDERLVGHSAIVSIQTMKERTFASADDEVSFDAAEAAPDDVL